MPIDDIRQVSPSPDKTASPPLWQQLLLTATVIKTIRAGQSWTTAQNEVDSELRTGVQALSFSVLRNLGSAQALRDLLVKKSPPPQADALLCVALALLAVPQMAYDQHTLVNQTVEAAKRSPVTAAQANFLNACLRRFLREREMLLAEIQANQQAKWNHPTWWIKRLQKDYPDHWQGILQANSQQAPLCLRVNNLKKTTAEYYAELTDVNAKIIPASVSALELSRSAYVPGLPGYKEGWFSVQDAAAQLAAPLLLAGFNLKNTKLNGQDRSLRILDACAAPGGKTAHLIEYAGVHKMAIDVVALDIDAARCIRIQENLQRLGLQSQIITADAANPTAWWDGEPFDAILLDAPCTASGIVRRHPDVRWLRRESDLVQLASLQKRLISVMWKLLKEQGRLLYCTCSVFKAEGQIQVQSFLAHNTDAVLLPSPGHLLPQSHADNQAMPDNHLGGHDGFYYALLQKNSTPAL